ncbi:VOC family protein [Xanthomonas sp. 3793]|uniref:VOC family protein n=1 Tax=Xanthomonas sp. 10-10 TaxID=3115848 RepID=A0AAU7P981_9XANT|nr:VOC family protein [Xanthomonas sp. 3793]MCS3748001.1 catechol-2,3-dioxygenase [Xanthomonas sp. 3793]
MSVALVRLIVYVHDVAAIKAFYQAHFSLPVLEEIADQWVVLAAGQIELALHLVGDSYRQLPASPASDPPRPAAGSTTKLVFAITSDLAAHREQRRSAGVPVGELKRYAGFAYQMYDGRDPEGNVFQVMRLD